MMIWGHSVRRSLALIVSASTAMLYTSPVSRRLDGVTSPVTGFATTNLTRPRMTTADINGLRSLPNEAGETNQARVSNSYGKLPMSFELNEGQVDPRVRFTSRSAGYALYLTSSEAVLRLGGSMATAVPERSVLSAVPDNRALQSQESKSAVLRIKLVGANATARVTGLNELAGKSNYFIGNDPKKWRVNVPNYASVRYEQVYRGVDLVYYGNQRRLEYDFSVAPGTSPTAIRLAFEGAELVAINASGDLALSTSGGEVCQHRPFVYQEVNGLRKEIPARYVKKGKSQIGFKVAAYDKNQPLIIDPVLSYSTYLGGSTVDEGFSIAVDSAGNAYVTGLTQSRDFPTANPLQPNADIGCCFGDAFVTKLNATGTALVYSTYIGGAARDQGNAIAVDFAGNAYITGKTDSTNFPISNALQPTHTGASSDAFVVKLNSTGSVLAYSTYLGGSSLDEGRGIAVDAAGNAYVTGLTGSLDFPTANPLQANVKGSDSFVTKVNSTGTALVYSTYLGGIGAESGRSIAVDSEGNAYVTGETSSPDLQLVNPVQSEIRGKTCFKSSDGASNWIEINNGLPARFSVNTLAIDPANPTTLYVGTSGAGVFKSVDGGSSWNAVNNTLATRALDQLVVDPRTTSTIYGITRGIVTKSTDGGISWSFPIIFGTFTAFAIDPITPANLYAAQPQTISKSTDGGATWRTVTVRDGFFVTASSIGAVAIDPTMPSTIYVGDSRGVFRSMDSGNTWRRITEFFFFFEGLAIDPVNTSTLYGRSRYDGVNKSTDGGLTWSFSSVGLTDKFVQVEAIDPRTTSTLYAGTLSGVYKSTDGGGSWSMFTNRLTNSSVTALTIDPQNTSTVYAGTTATSDAFVAKLDSAGSALLYSTYLGGDTSDFALCIAVDASGNAYIGGLTQSLNFPTKNPLQEFSGGLFDAFVAKLSTTRSELAYSTYLGGNGYDAARGIAVDSAGSAYVVGQTLSADFPTVAPLQAFLADVDGDPFVAKLNATGSALVFSTYLGGGGGAFHSSGFDFGMGIALDSGGNAYITGATASDNFPTTPGAFQLARRGTSLTAFVAKISEPLAFDVCLQDETNIGDFVQINTTTGDFVFYCRSSVVASGRGTLHVRGSMGSIEFNKGDRRVYAQWDTTAQGGKGSGTAMVQSGVNNPTCQITDKDMSNNTCIPPGPSSSRGGKAAAGQQQTMQ